MITFLITIGIILLFILFYIITTYNNLVTLRNRVRDQWAQVHVQLKKRADLVPNLVETVKGYARHERETFDEVISARNKATTAKTIEAEMDANNMLTNTLGRLFALVEAYPDLKANQNFLSLQADLKDIEEKIAYARQFYNDSVYLYNNRTEVFPSNIIAASFKFEKSKFFEASEEETKTPTVKF